MNKKTLMRTFLLGGYPHRRGISRISYLTDLSVSSLSIKTEALHFYIYIYIHFEAWFARDIMIHTLAIGNINYHTCVLKCQR
jgi:hypothetical protein